MLRFNFYYLPAIFALIAYTLIVVIPVELFGWMSFGFYLGKRADLPHLFFAQITLHNDVYSLVFNIHLHALGVTFLTLFIFANCLFA